VCDLDCYDIVVKYQLKKGSGVCRVCVTESGCVWFLTLHPHQLTRVLIKYCDKNNMERVQ